MKVRRNLFGFQVRILILNNALEAFQNLNMQNIANPLRPRPFILVPTLLCRCTFYFMVELCIPLEQIKYTELEHIKSFLMGQ